MHVFFFIFLVTFLGLNAFASNFESSFSDYSAVDLEKLLTKEKFLFNLQEEIDEAKKASVDQNTDRITYKERIFTSNSKSIYSSLNNHMDLNKLYEKIDLIDINYEEYINTYKKIILYLPSSVLSSADQKKIKSFILVNDEHSIYNILEQYRYKLNDLKNESYFYILGLVESRGGKRIFDCDYFKSAYEINENNMDFLMSFSECISIKKYSFNESIALQKKLITLLENKIKILNSNEFNTKKHALLLNSLMLTKAHSLIKSNMQEAEVSNIINTILKKEIDALINTYILIYKNKPFSLSKQLDLITFRLGRDSFNSNLKGMLNLRSLALLSKTNFLDSSESLDKFYLPIICSESVHDREEETRKACYSLLMRLKTRLDTVTLFKKALPMFEKLSEDQRRHLFLNETIAIDTNLSSLYKSDNLTATILQFSKKISHPNVYDYLEGKIKYDETVNKDQERLFLINHYLINQQKKLYGKYEEDLYVNVLFYLKNRDYQNALKEQFLVLKIKEQPSTPNQNLAMLSYIQLKLNDTSNALNNFKKATQVTEQNKNNIPDVSCNENYSIYAYNLSILAKYIAQEFVKMKKFDAASNIVLLYKNYCKLDYPSYYKLLGEIYENQYEFSIAQKFYTQRLEFILRDDHMQKKLQWERDKKDMILFNNEEKLNTLITSKNTFIKTKKEIASKPIYYNEGYHLQSDKEIIETLDKIDFLDKKIHLKVPSKVRVCNQIDNQSEKLVNDVFHEGCAE